MQETNTSAIEIPGDMINKWQGVVDIMAELMSVPAALIMRLQPGEMEVFRSSQRSRNPFQAGMRFQLEGLYCRAVIQNRERTHIPNALAHEWWKESAAACTGYIAYLGFPLFWPNGELFGTVCVLDAKENRFEGVIEELMIQFKELIESHLGLLFANHELARHAKELEHSLEEIHKLRGILPICAMCKRIRNDEGYWQAVDVYLREHGEMKFSHGYCPECLKIARADMA